jgi:hypothetical protein
VLDRETGRFFRASATAVQIAEALTRGLGPEEIAARLGARFAVTPARVEADVHALVAALERPLERRAGNAVRFRRAPEGHCMSVAGRDVAMLSPDGRVLQRLDVTRDVEGDRDDARALVRLALPHALTLQGVTVLHASAVHVAEAVHAFCGPSGAGKTTLAAALVAAGATEESEDLVLLVPGASAPTVACGAERWLRAWVDAHAEDAQLSVPEIGVLAAWPARAPLARVAFLEARGAGLATARLDAADVCVRLLANAFAELEEPHVFDGCLRDAAAIARGVEGVGLVVPEGLAALADAAGRYSSSTRS